MRTLREIDRYYDRAHQELERQGVPNPMIKGEPGATQWAYPNGMLHQRIGRWVARQARRVLRREGASSS